MASATPGRRRPLGILMLEGKMAQVPGCMACAETFPYPVVRQVVTGSRTPLTAEEAWEMLPLYVAAARDLERAGVAAITANCGLIALMQRELAAAVAVPVVTSALLLVPLVHRMIGGRRVGILTFFADAVGEANYRASGWSETEIPVALDGVGEHASWREFLRTKETPEPLRARLAADLLAVARRLVARYPDVGALVSECTMLPACLEAVRARLPLPVYDVLTAVDLVMAGSFRPAAAAGGAELAGPGGERGGRGGRRGAEVA